MNILVTGSGGSLGIIPVKLADNGHKVFGIDNINEYYDSNLKCDRRKC